jgi:hypothetical protein
MPPRPVAAPTLWRYSVILLLGVLAGCPGTEQTKWPRSLAEGFLKNVFEGNLEAAAAYTVDDFQYSNRDAVVQMVKGKVWRVASENVSPTGDEAFFEGTWDAEPGKGTFVVRMSKKDGKWRVDKFNAHKE